MSFLHNIVTLLRRAFPLHVSSHAFLPISPPHPCALLYRCVSLRLCSQLFLPALILLLYSTHFSAVLLCSPSLTSKSTIYSSLHKYLVPLLYNCSALLANKHFYHTKTFCTIPPYVSFYCFEHYSCAALACTSPSHMYSALFR